MASKWRSLGVRSAALMLGGALLLPGVNAHAAVSYTANDTDTFWSMSKQFHVPLNKLLKANPNVNPLNIHAGLKITVPSGKPAAPQAKTVQALTTAKGESVSFSKVLSVKASAYSDSPAENGWGPVDYFGNRLKLGTIAVDPKVIPFGTRVFITGYDFKGLPTGGMIAKATDSGSAIKGKRIDIFVPGSRSFVSKFGMQNVKVYILK
jgi:3D (Asp-Asp-Asp) domain-containing protein